MADLRGFQILSISWSFWENSAKNHMLAPPRPPESWRPQLGEILDPPLIRVSAIFYVCGWVPELFFLVKHRHVQKKLHREVWIHYYVCIWFCLQDVSPEEVAEELPPLQPRYVVYSYKYEHDDGRVSYPLCFIFVSPQGKIAGCRISLLLLLSSKNGTVGCRIWWFATIGRLQDDP